MNNDQLYVSIFIKQRRLATEHARKNAEEVVRLRMELKALEMSGTVSQKTIDTAPYLSWRGRSCL